MARKTCTPFCDTRKTCPKHHDLLLAVVGCSDMRDKRGNMTEFEDTVKCFLKKGWKREDEIPDPVKNYRFPLLHWAGVLGKCRAMEWMIKNGFSTTVRSSDTQETALHRCVLCLHYTKIRRLSEKIRQMINLLQDCLPLQDKALQTPLHAAATKLITGNKSDYYEECLGQMVAKAAKIPGKTAEILNARDLHGNTVLHYLAQNEIGLVTLRAIVDAGGDISVRNKKKLTPLNIAMNNGCTRVIKILSTAQKNSRHSSRYDSSIYTTDSPPESPVNTESLENSQNERFHVDHPYSISGNSSSHNIGAPALECTEDSSFSTSEEESFGEVPSGVTEDDVPSGSSDAAHSDKPSDGPSSDLDVPSCVVIDPPADVTDDGPSGCIDDAPPCVRDNAPVGATDDTPGVANSAPSSVTDKAPSKVRDMSFTITNVYLLVDTKDSTPNVVTENAHAAVADDTPAGVPDGAPAGGPDNTPVGLQDISLAGVPDNAPAGVPDNAPAGVLDNAPAGVPDDAPAGVPDDAPAGVPDDAPAGVPDNAPTGVTDTAPAGVPDDATAGVTDNAHAGTPDNAPAGVPDDAPAGTTDEASSINTGNAHSVTGDATSGNLSTTEETPTAAYDDPDDETYAAMSDGDKTPSDNESELADHHVECESNAIGVQTPGIDPYSCIVHIKQEMVSPKAKWVQSAFRKPVFAPVLQCEKCRQESMGENTSSLELLQHATTSDLASSVVNLLKGAGLLGNLTEIAEKKRAQDEHLLTDKLEMVKETNNELESSEKEIEGKKSKIEEMLLEVEELRKQVKRKAEEREELFSKRKRLNDECNILQKKLHCCDSLLKVVPKVDSDISSS